MLSLQSLDDLLKKQKANLHTTLDNVAAISNNVNQLSDSLAQSNIKQSIASFETNLDRLNSSFRKPRTRKRNHRKIIKRRAVV